MKYYNFDEVQKTAKQNKGFVMGEHEAGRKHHELIRAVLNSINDELISSTSCATASVFKGDSDDREYVFIDIAYTVESDGAINDAKCIFEALATDENINLANEIVARIKEKYNIDIFLITHETEGVEAAVFSENQELYQTLINAIQNIHFKIHAIYDPDRNTPFADCYMAAVELFTFGQTYRLYFKINENNQIEVEHLERWYFG